MTELILMPTTNWLTCRSIDISYQNSEIAFSALTSIILTNKTLGSYKTTIKDAHSKRISAVAFYNGITTEDYSVLASCSEDMEVRVWNTKTHSLIAQHKLHQNVPVCLDWLQLDSNENTSNNMFLLSSDIKGNIFKYNIHTSAHTRYFPENKPISQMRVCPNSYIAAVGYKQGTIVILDVKSEQNKIIHKLKSHEDTINCLHWFPLNGIENETDHKMRLKFSTENLSKILCSSSEDKTIRFWCTERGIELEKIDAPGIKDTNKKPTSTNMGFTPLCWPIAKQILSSSFKGDLYTLDLTNQNGQAVWRPFVGDKPHKKVIYEIGACGSDKVITLSLDRLVNMWSLNDMKQIGSMTTLNGYVYSIVSSPIEPDVVALSVGDSSIKLLNEKQDRRVTKHLSNNIKSEVTQISWHPTKENIIAFGTKDGKVGIIDTLSNNKPAQYIYSGFNQSVYTLLWSVPIISMDKSNEVTEIENTDELAWRAPKPTPLSYALYSVADSRIMQHTVQFLSGTGHSGQIVAPSAKSINFYEQLKKELEPSDETTKTNSLVEYGLTEFAVLIPSKTNSKLKEYPPLLYFIIGKFDGSMEIYSKQKNSALTFLCTLFNHQKLITCSKWNCNFSLLATGSNDFNVIVVGFDELVSECKAKTCKGEVKFYSKFNHKLVGHKERVTSLAWSICQEFNMLASCSYDATVQIWNADLGIGLANYRGHSEKILCCMFSSNDFNVVYSGGEDYSMHKWRIDQQTDLLPPEECSTLMGKKKKKFVKKLRKSETSIDIVTSEANWRPKLEYESLPMIEDKTAEVTPVITKPAKSTGQQQQANRELKSLLMLSSLGNKSQKTKLQECLSLFEVLYEKNEDIVREIKAGARKINFDNWRLDIPNEHINLAMFGNRETVIKLIETEHAELKRLNSDKWYILDVWLGNLAKLFNDLHQQNNLNDIIFNLYQISVSSNPITLDFLGIYIEQLSKGGTSTSNEKVHKAAMYALASYDVHKAIEIYTKNCLFVYALVIGQLRLSANDPCLENVLNKYGVYATTNGNYETGVMCYIRNGDFESAYKALWRRSVKGDEESETLIKTLMGKLVSLMPENSEINVGV